MAGITTYVMGNMLGGTVLSETGQAAFSSSFGNVFGYCYDSGIGEEITVFCGVTIEEKQEGF